MPDSTLYPIEDFDPPEQGRQFIVRLKNSSGTLANSKVITIENLGRSTALPNCFTSPTLTAEATTFQRQAYYQKTIAIPGASAAQVFDQEVCSDQREFVEVVGSTSGRVYGGGRGTPYSADSDINTAAVHSGLVSPGVRVLLRRINIGYFRNSDPLKLSFIGNTNSGVTTLSRLEGCGYRFDPSVVIFITTSTSTTSTSTTSTSTTTTAAPTTSTTSTTTIAGTTTTTSTTTASGTTTTSTSTTTTGAPGPTTTSTSTTTTSGPTTTSTSTTSTTTSGPGAPVIVTFTFDNGQTTSSAIANDNPNFIWNVTNSPTTLTITPIVGGTPGSPVNVLGQGTAVNPSSEVMGTISQTTTFRLTASNAGGSTTADIVLTIEAQVSTTFNLLSPVANGDAIIGAFTPTVADRAYIRRQDPGPTYVNVYGSAASPITVTPGQLYSGINLGTADYVTMGGSVSYLITVFLSSNLSNTVTVTRVLTINAPSSISYRFDVINSTMSSGSTQDVTIVSPSSNTGPFSIQVRSGPGLVKPFASGSYGSSANISTNIVGGEPEATGKFKLQATGSGSIIIDYYNGATLVNTTTVTSLSAGETTTTTTTTSGPTTTTTTLAPAGLSIDSFNYSIVNIDANTYNVILTWTTTGADQCAIEIYEGASLYDSYTGQSADNPSVGLTVPSLSTASFYEARLIAIRNSDSSQVTSSVYF